MGLLTLGEGLRRVPHLSQGKEVVTDLGRDETPTEKSGKES